MNATEFPELFDAGPRHVENASVAMTVAEYELVPEDADIRIPSYYEAPASNAWPNRDCVWIGDYITVPTFIS